MDEIIFVYGTLRPSRPDTGQEDSRYYLQIAAHVKEHMPAQLPNAQLFDMGAYPAARPGDATILGDLLVVDAEALKIIDRIEGHPNFYYRDRVTVLAEGGPMEAWIYWAPASLPTGGFPIESGDWFDRPDSPADLADTPKPSPGTQEDPAHDESLVNLVRRFSEVDSIWLGTVRPDGRAHTTPVWHVWRRGRIYVVISSSSVKAANIDQNPSVVATHPDPNDPVIIEGWATRTPFLQETLRPAFQAKYDWDIVTDQEYDTVIEITPLKLMAWGKYGQGRWPGSELLGIRL